MDLTDLVDLLELLASGPRLKILAFLREVPLSTVSDISTGLRLQHNKVSKHLQLLSSRRLVCPHEDGAFVRYCLNLPLIGSTLDKLTGLIAQKEPNAANTTNSD